MSIELTPPELSLAMELVTHTVSDPDHKNSTARQAVAVGLERKLNHESRHVAGRLREEIKAMERQMTP